MRIYREEPVVEHLYRVGEWLRQGFEQAARDNGIEDYLKIGGRPCNLLYTTLDHEGRPSQAYRALFMQELIRWGVLAPSFIVSYSHEDDDIDLTVEAIQRAAAGLSPRDRGPVDRWAADRGADEGGLPPLQLTRRGR